MKTTKTSLPGLGFLLGILFSCAVSTVSAQVCSAICNSGFDGIQLLTPNTMGLFTQNNVPCWKTTATDSIIEIWGTGFNGVNSYSGNQFVELNGTMLSTLYQDFIAAPGSTATISFAHRGRAGTDVMSLSIGPVGGPYTLVGTFSAGNTAWVYHSVSYTFPNNANTNYSLRFNSVSAAGGDPAIGNFLDAVTVTLAQPTVSIDVTDASCTMGGSLTAHVSGGAPSYSYNWQPSLGNSPTHTNVAAGTYDLIVTDAHGCTGSATATISGGSSFTTISASICGNEPYYFNGTPYTQSGTYQFEYTTTGGCDSTIVLELEAHPIYRDSFFVSPCSDEPVTYNGQVYPPIVGVYDFTFQSIYGCDSLVRMYIGPALQVYAEEDTICAGDSVQLHIWGGDTYQWSPANLFDDPTSGNPIASVTETTELTVYITTISDDGLEICGAAIEHITITVLGHETVYALGDTLICIGNTVPLSGIGAETYTWSPAASLDDSQISHPLASPGGTTWYQMEATTSKGCVIRDSVLVQVVTDLPIPFMPDSVSTCRGSSIGLSVSGADSYVWSPAAGISPLNGATVTLNPLNDLTYYCDFSNVCGTVRDSVYLEVNIADIQAGSDTVVCPKEMVILHAFGGVSYEWFPSVATLSGNQVIVYPDQNTLYFAVGTDSNGCTDTAWTDVQVYPQPFVQVTDEHAVLGEDVQLNAHAGNSTGIFTWYPAEYLNCNVCQDPIAHPDRNMSYEVTFIDSNGCKATDKMTIFYDPQVYVPNAFIPDGNNLNDQFKAVCSNVDEFELFIYDRWGEEVFRTNTVEQGWDGTHQSKACAEGIYNWTIRYVGSDNTIKVLVGHVNLLR
ncbi:gliding motility-associated C-terminal domain-containing protein [Fluviicola taffensis]|uniref:T9SS type B sorting domain-containing protein n=1 Tax=Fluviicola taffensis TaxID=191579 RepID=UPI0031382356